MNHWLLDKLGLPEATAAMLRRYIASTGNTVMTAIRDAMALWVAAHVDDQWNNSPQEE